MRSCSSEGYFRLQYHKKLRGLMDTDRPLRDFMEQETDVIPEFYTRKIVKSLGVFSEYLPEDSLAHDQNAYLKKAEQNLAVKIPAE